MRSNCHMASAVSKLFSPLSAAAPNATSSSRLISNVLIINLIGINSGLDFIDATENNGLTPAVRHRNASTGGHGRLHPHRPWRTMMRQHAYNKNHSGTRDHGKNVHARHVVVTV